LILFTFPHIHYSAKYVFTQIGKPHALTRGLTLYVPQVSSRQSSTIHISNISTTTSSPQPRQSVAALNPLGSALAPPNPATFSANHPETRREKLSKKPSTYIPKYLTTHHDHLAYTSTNPPVWHQCRIYRTSSYSPYASFSPKISEA
jgi:hypothetical protein